MPNATVSTRRLPRDLPLNRVALGPAVRVLTLRPRRMPAEVYNGLPVGVPVGSSIFADLLAGSDPNVIAPKASR